jgi:hypothetical protein
MAKKKINPAEIDESFIIASIKKEKKPEEIGNTNQNKESKIVEAQQKQTEEPTELIKKEKRKRQGKQQDYESLFIKDSGITARLGKTVYIRKEFHDRILKITQIIAGNDLSIFSYIDNVLAHHFEVFHDEITQSYNQKNSGIF